MFLGPPSAQLLSPLQQFSFMACVTEILIVRPLIHSETAFPFVLLLEQNILILF